VAPILALPIALAQGFGKRRAMASNPRRPRRLRANRRPAGRR
jgi:hypothetical protein